MMKPPNRSDGDETGVAIAPVAATPPSQDVSAAPPPQGTRRNGPLHGTRDEASRIHFATRRRSHGFTLIEVMLAVAIMAVTTLGISRFVGSTLRAVKASVEDTEEQLSVERLVALVQEEFYGLPARGQTNIQGESIKLNGADFDSIEWRSRGGPGLMTTAATGEYRVKLRIQPIEKNSNKYEIGFWRRPALLDTAGGLVAGGSDNDATWVPLMQRVAALRLRYWDARLGQLLDSWRDPTVRPSFVIMSITREGEETPYEAVLRIPISAVQ